MKVTDHRLSIEGESIAVEHHVAARGTPEQHGRVTVVILHGAGSANKARSRDLIALVARAGADVCALDFSGHGESSGLLAHSSLRLRWHQAHAVINELVPRQNRLSLVGFSMGAQTVADLLPEFGGRVIGIGLCSPAIYAAEAWSARFDSGFSDLIRQPESWATSTAWRALSAFYGAAVLATPVVDGVIPRQVTERVARSLAGARLQRLQFPRSGHQLGIYFAANEAARERFAGALAKGWQAA